MLQVTVAELRERVAAAEAERDRLLALVERLTAERLPPSRRPWPGLQSWWQWLWTGESGG